MCYSRRIVMLQPLRTKTEIKLEYLNGMMACRYDLGDKLCTMRLIKAAGDFAKDCIRDIRETEIESTAEKAFYEKALQNIAAVSIYNAIINRTNTCVEIEKCLEDVSYLETITDVVTDYTDDLLIRCITESIKQDILAHDSIFSLSNKKYDDLRTIYEKYRMATP